jgi:hypothetical protein
MLHMATFEKPHNWNKGMVFLTLYKHQYRDASVSGMTEVELRKIIKSSHDLCGQLQRWVKYNYLKRKIGINAYGHPAYYYHLAERGYHFIRNRMSPEIRSELIEELKKEAE